MKFQNVPKAWKNLNHVGAMKLNLLCNNFFDPKIARHQVFVINKFSIDFLLSLVKLVWKIHYEWISSLCRRFEFIQWSHSIRQCCCFSKTFSNFEFNVLPLSLSRFFRIFSDSPIHLMFKLLIIHQYQNIYKTYGFWNVELNSNWISLKC